MADRRITAAELAAGLAADIDALAAQCLPNGKRIGTEWRAVGPNGATWVVCLAGHKRGVFLDTGAGSGGDALELATRTMCRGDRRAGFEWAARRLGLWVDRDPDAPRPDPAEDAAERARRAEEAARREAVRREREAAEIERRRRLAFARFLGGAPIGGTPAASYLAGRAVAPSPSEPLGALRFAPSIKHPAGYVLPAMLAAVIDPATRKHIATHHTFLEERAGAWRKARVEPAKITLGPFRGGVIPLLRGVTRKPVAAAEDETLLIGEGIENVLSVGRAFPDRRAWAAVAVGNLAAIAIPERFVDVMLIKDRDGENDGPRQARDRAVHRWLHEGRAVTEWAPPPGYKDANEWWQALHDAHAGRQTA